VAGIGGDPIINGDAAQGPESRMGDRFA